MKRVNAIVKAVNKLTEVFDRKVKRILRSVDAAIDSAKDHADLLREEADNIMISLGEVADGDEQSREKLQTLLCRYAEKMEEAATYDRYAEHFEHLKAKLNEDVEVEQ